MGRLEVPEKVERREDREAPSRWQKRPGDKAPAVFKTIVLFALLGATAYGMLDSGLYGAGQWLTVAAGTLGLFIVTLFVSGFYSDVPRAGWILTAFLATLVLVKGLSMTWTISETLTVQELVRSAMYLAIFILSLAALYARRQVGPVVDAAVLIVAAVAGYGLMQKLYPTEYPVSSLDGVRVDSTVGYANTVAMILAMGVLLALARTSQVKNAAVRGGYAALTLCFLAALFLTVSRGGISSLGIGLVCFFVLTKDRLQTFANALLLAVPAGWLVWKMQSLEGLLQAEASGQQKIEAGLQLRTELLISAGAAFVLQTAYAFFANRYEPSQKTRRVAAVLAGAGAMIIVCAGIAGVAVRYGGVGQAYDTLPSNPSNTQDVTARLTSLSIGFRAEYWQVAWEEWKEHPLGGTGAGTFPYTWLQERPGYTDVKQVHNVYLEQGTETGVFAFLALVGFAALLVAYAARGAWRSESGTHRTLLAGLVGALVVYLASSAFEWHWYIPSSTMLFFILSGVAVKAAYFREREQQPREEESVPAPDGSGGGG